ncbi:MAG: tRNA pseudouridine(13) synthase TruD [Nanoarchaeota archaeon]|nr:tRNA pseudouridine(13) synthase TruD [Nanoarchaeota archaeon]MBU1704002.1 tRNA pseudouridine(13) synthase TruD [Nanoarchaeota archaeon]
MYSIKQIPEDFQVKEISKVDIGQVGHFTYFVLKKKNYTTVGAIEQIAEKLKIKPNRFGFAGNKDRVAVTTQLVSVKDIPKDPLERISLKDISIEVLGYGARPVSLGDLFGNDFLITVRNLSKDDLDRLDAKVASGMMVPNFFGEQRFSENNAEIGKAIVKRDFKKAVKIILKTQGDYEMSVKEHLEEHKEDYIGALRKINKKILRIFLSAFQSDIFNQTVRKYISSQKENVMVPIVGFGTEIDDPMIDVIVMKIMEKEGVIFRDFVIREMPELSFEGSERPLYVSVDNLRIVEVGKDTINKKYKVVLSFTLGSGSYATEVIKYLFE